MSTPTLTSAIPVETFTGSFTIYSPPTTNQWITTPFSYPASCWTEWGFTSSAVPSTTRLFNYFATSLAKSCQPSSYFLTETFKLVTPPSGTGTAFELAVYSLPHLSPGVCPVGHTIAAPLTYLPVISTTIYEQENSYISRYPTTTTNQFLESYLSWQGGVYSTTILTKTRTIAHCCRV
jgi:hypothetical protein